ncbi:MAG: hypothetical protein DRJ47_06085 [Thermoprotei archaeon]|nr:MAG: hypothetical protein DRJ47_06085 [Thermoprotei archaeon]
MTFEHFCPVCKDNTMEKIEEGEYRCRKCGLGRKGNPDRDLVVIYDRPLPENAQGVDGKLHYFRIPPENLSNLVKSLPQNQWYSLIWDSDGDFLITNEENRGILPDLFCEMKRRKESDC